MKMQYAKPGQQQYCDFRTYNAHVHVCETDIKQSNLDVMGIVAGISLVIAGYWAWPIFVAKVQVLYHALPPLF